MSLDWALFLQAACGAALVLAGVAKLVGRARVTPFLEELGLRRVTGLSVALVPAEVILGVTLSLGGAGLVLLGATALLTFLFVLLHLAARIRHVESPCACFGALDANDSRSLSEIRAVALCLTASAAVMAAAITDVPWVQYPRGLTASSGAGVASGLALALSIALLSAARTFEGKRLLVLELAQSANADRR